MASRFSKNHPPRKYILLLLLVGVSQTVLSQPSLHSSSAHPSKKDTPNITFYIEIVESEFPGGLEAWQRFISQKLTYPSKAVREKIQGTVMLQFIVDKEGALSDIQAMSGPDILKEAALKAISQSPRWKPAMQDGRKVKSYKKQPIVFKLLPA